MIHDFSDDSVESGVPLRFRIHPKYIRDSILASIEEIRRELAGVREQCHTLALTIYTDPSLPYEKPEGLTLPVSFTPKTNWVPRAELVLATQHFINLSRELGAYESYLEYIMSEDGELEIEPASTTFYRTAEEVNERLEIDEGDENEDVFAAAERKQRELLASVVPNGTATTGDDSGRVDDLEGNEDD